MTIHKEGHNILIVLMLIILGINAVAFRFIDNLYVLTALAFIGFFIFILVLQFFRSPDRMGDDRKEATIICPADGKIVAIEEVTETEFFNDKRIQVSIFMSPFNVHVNRYAVAGTVVLSRYHQGKYLVAWHPKSSTENERTTVVVEHNSGKQVMMRQIAGALARRIICYAEEQAVVNKGEEMGFIKFGSRVDIFLPTDTKISVKLDQKVKGGETIIGELLIAESNN